MSIQNVVAARRAEAVRAKEVLERRVTVVEDDPDVRMLVKRILSNAGMTVEDVASAEGLSASLDAGNSPSVIVLDLTLPGSSGWSVLSALRADPKRAAIEIVILTGRDDDQFRSAAKQAGVAAYITKPFKAQVLVDAVTRAMAKGYVARDAWGSAI